jgi:23S rRNA pseudouridine1911/1915/1917 synthase
MEEENKKTEEQLGETEDNLFLETIVQVDPGQTQIRIDKYLMDRLNNISRNRVQNAIKSGAIKVNEKEIKSNYKVRPNDTISVLIPKHPDYLGDVIAEDIPLDIVYEDAYLLVVNKPAGLVVHPGVGNRSGTLVNALRFYLQQQEIPVMEGNSMDRPGLVHRIDKDTSGLLVIAKEEYAMTHLAKQFFDHSIHRTYQAVVWGNFDEPEGTIDVNIGRHPKDRVKQYVFADGEDGKEAITHYKVLEDMYYISLVECRLETGRTHQIRVHMGHKHHPIFSDAKYGGDKIIKGTVFSKYKHFVENCFKMMPRQALHAKSLSFIHPHTKEQMTFDSDLPSDMHELLEKWRHYLHYRKEQME